MLHGLSRSSLPLRRELLGVVLFLDINGFTVITETAAHKGRYGVELVTDVINRHFNGIAALIRPCGGEIFKFGGDSCLIVFPEPDPQSWAQILLLPSQIEAHARKLDKFFFSRHGIRFALHGCLCYGNIALNLVGDPALHLDYYLDGEAISRAYQLADQSDHIVCSLPPAPYGESIRASLTTANSTSRLSLPLSLFLAPSVRTKLAEGDLRADLRNAAVVFVHLQPQRGEYFELTHYDPVFRQIQRFVYRYEGLINKIDYTEKGYLILLVFGIPFLHQDDIERAFICATRISQIRSEGLELKIGLNYRDIFVGKIGASNRWEYGIIGNAVNIAARLMSFAGAGEICLSDEFVERISSRFETQFLAHSKVKGIKNKIGIHKLVRELPQQWHRYQINHSKHPFVLDCPGWTEACSSLSDENESLILIRGASGCGKSYLAWLCCTYYESKGREFAIISTDSYSQSLRLEVFFRTVRSCLGLTNLREQFSDLCGFMTASGISFDPTALHKQLFGTINPKISDQLNELVMNSIFDLLTVCYPPDKLLVIDPLELFDPQSRRLLLNLTKRNLAAGGKVVICSTDPDLAPTDEYSRCYHLELHPLNPAGCLDLIRNSFPLASGEAVLELGSISAGNPGFLTELIRVMGKHHNADDLITAQEIRSLQARGLIPDKIENLLMSEYQSSRPAVQQLLRSASIFLGSFSHPELEHIAPHSSLDGLLRHCCEQGWLLQTELLPYPVYRFNNSLLQESVYRSILLADKKKLHLKMASFYEQSLAQNDPGSLEKTALHYINSGESKLIFTWALRLAEEYQSRGALELSLQNWEILIRHSPDKTRQTQARLSRLEILLKLARNEDAQQELQALQELSRRKGLLRDRYYHLWTMYYNNCSLFHELKAFAAKVLLRVQDQAISYRIRLQYLEMLAAQGERELFLAQALPLYDDLQKADWPFELSSLCGVLGQFYLNQGSYTTAYRYYHSKSKLSEQLHDPIGQRISRSGMGNALFRQGKKDKALQLYQEALQISEKSGDRNGYSKALLNIGAFHRNRGDYDNALLCYQKSLRIARFMGNLMQESIIIYDIGELLSYQERHDEALQHFQDSLAIAHKIGDESGKSFCYDAIGDNHFKRGNYQEAKEIYIANLQLQLRINDQEGIAHTYGNLGNIAKMESNWQGAREYYLKQYEILREVQDLDGCGRAWFNLAMIDLETEDSSSAREKLERALQFFKDCQAEYYIQITQEQLELLT